MNEQLQQSDARHYETVGWLSITSAVLLLPSMVLGFILELTGSTVVLVILLPYVLLVSVAMGLSLYALYRFKGLLNDRYQFHDVDSIITAMIILSCVLGVVAIGAKVAGALLRINVDDPVVLLPLVLAAVAFFALVGLPLAILSIVFAVRLLRLRDDLYGLLKPYAYTTIVASALFATLIFAFLGLLLDAACSVMLGIIFLRAARGLPTPEFV